MKRIMGYAGAVLMRIGQLALGIYSIDDLKAIYRNPDLRLL